MSGKFCANAASAVEGVPHDGMTIMAGGFGLCGIPENLIAALRASWVTDLTFVSNNCGVDGFGLGLLLENGQIRKMIASYVGENKLFEKLYLSGKVELEFNPQGTLAERIRAGIPAFYTRTGFGRVIAVGKESKELDGKWYLMERGLVADLAIVKAWKGDTGGNLVYQKTASNFNPIMAAAAKVTLVESRTWWRRAGSTPTRFTRRASMWTGCLGALCSKSGSSGRRPGPARNAPQPARRSDRGLDPRRHGRPCGGGTEGRLLTVVELAKGVTLDEIKTKAEAEVGDA